MEKASACLKEGRTVALRELRYIIKRRGSFYKSGKKRKEEGKYVSTDSRAMLAKGTRIN